MASSAASLVLSNLCRVRFSLSIIEHKLEHLCSMFAMCTAEAYTLRSILQEDPEVKTLCQQREFGGQMCAEAASLALYLKETKP